METRKLIATIVYYVIISPLLLLGVLPIYLCAVLDVMQREGRWLGIKEFRSELEK